MRRDYLTRPIVRSMIDRAKWHVGNEDEDVWIRVLAAVAVLVGCGVALYFAVGNDFSRTMAHWAAASGTIGSLGMLAWNAVRQRQHLEEIDRDRLERHSAEINAWPLPLDSEPGPGWFHSDYWTQLVDLRSEISGLYNAHAHECGLETVNLAPGRFVGSKMLQEMGDALSRLGAERQGQVPEDLGLAIRLARAWGFPQNLAALRGLEIEVRNASSSPAYGVVATIVNESGSPVGTIDLGLLPPGTEHLRRKLEISGTSGVVVAPGDDRADVLRRHGVELEFSVTGRRWRRDRFGRLTPIPEQAKVGPATLRLTAGSAVAEVPGGSADQI